MGVRQLEIDWSDEWRMTCRFCFWCQEDREKTKGHELLDSRGGHAIKDGLEDSLPSTNGCNYEHFVSSNEQCMPPTLVFESSC